MLKSGLIVGVIMLVLALAATLLSPLCAPCIALFVGLGAGFLAGVFDKPLESGGSAKSGAAAGAIGGGGGLVGAMIAAVVNAIFVGPDRAAEIMRQLGMSSGPGTTEGYYIGAFGGPCCIGLFDVALMAGLGALGGLLWYQILGKRTSALPTVQ